MPQEPKRRHSKQRKGKRRASIRLSRPSFISCPNCKNIMLTHTVCKKCGFYDGKQVLTIKKNPPAGEKKTESTKQIT